MWHEGTLDGYRYQVKTCEEPSELYGIDGGRVIKLWVQHEGREVLNYDRGWDKETQCEQERAILAQLLKKYN